MPSRDFIPLGITKIACVSEQKASRSLVGVGWKYWADVSLDVDGVRIPILGDDRDSSESLLAVQPANGQLRSGSMRGFIEGDHNMYLHGCRVPEELDGLLDWFPVQRTVNQGTYSCHLL